MPALLVAAAAALASYGAGALATYLGASVLVAQIVGSVAGMVVAMAGSMLLSALTPKPKLPDYSQDRTLAIRSGIEPQRVAYGRTMVSGPVVYIGSSGPEQAVLHIVVAFTGHPIDDFEEIWLNGDRKIPLVAPGTDSPDPLDRSGGAHGGTVRIHTYDGTQTAADPDLIAEQPAEWTEDHILTGCAYVYLRIDYNIHNFDSFQSVAAVVRGKKVWDPRDDTTAWSANAALCILDYLLSETGLNADQDEEIDLAYWEAAANICDETVPLVSGGSITEPRYELHGSLKLSQNRGDIMEDMLSTCGGALLYVAGAYRLTVAVYETPEIMLTVSDMAGDLKVVPVPPRRSVINTINGTYMDPAQNWTPVSMPPVTVADFVEEDGETIEHSVEFPFCTSRTQVQRLARLSLLRARQALTIQVPLKLSGQAVSVWTMIGLTVDTLGWEEKAFRVTDWQFDPGTGQVVITAREEHASSYTWLYSDAGPDLSDFEPTFILPRDMVTPDNVTVTPTTVLQPDGAAAPALVVTWDVQANPFVTSVEVQWRVDGDTEWSSQDIAVPAAKAIIAPVVSGLDYDVRVRAKAAFLLSEWSSTTTETALPDTTVPDDPTSLAAAAISTGISITWTNPSDHDLVAVEIYENTSSSSGGRYFIGETSGGRFLRTGLGGGVTRYYWVRARDRSGNVSDYVGPVDATSMTVGTSDLTPWAASGHKYVANNNTLPIYDFEMTTVSTAVVNVPDGGGVMIYWRADVTTIALPGDSGDGVTGDGGDSDAGS